MPLSCGCSARKASSSRMAVGTSPVYSRQVARSSRAWRWPRIGRHYGGEQGERAGMIILLQVRDSEIQLEQIVGGADLERARHRRRSPWRYGWCASKRHRGCLARRRSGAKPSALRGTPARRRSTRRPIALARPGRRRLRAGRPPGEHCQQADARRAIAGVRFIRTR